MAEVAGPIDPRLAGSPGEWGGLAYHGGGWRQLRGQLRLARRRGVAGLKWRGGGGC